MALNDFVLVLFGGTGDLSMRKLLPALYARDRAKDFPEGGRILCIGREPMGTSAFVATVEKKSMPNIAHSVMEPAVWQRFCQRIVYVRLDAKKPEDYAALASTMHPDKEIAPVFYLAMPSNLFAGICTNLATAGLVTPTSHVVLEKPLGRDMASAKAINAAVGSVFAASQIFRIDHHLGKEAVQNFLALHFGNVLFEPLWRRDWISDVQITMAERLGVGGRSGSYDHAGALRDMLQNLLCIVAMEPPILDDADAVRNEKLKVLHSLKPFTRATLASNLVRGQYRTGHIEGASVPGYRNEPDADPESRTETFVALKAEVDTWRWAGVPFYLRTGKPMADQLAEIVVRFKPVPHPIFNTNSDVPNCLVIRLQPDEGLHMNLMAKMPGDGMRLKPVELELDFRAKFKTARMNAYERLLLDILRGQLTLFMRSDELEAARTWVEPILNYWEQEENDPIPYAAGTWCPAASSVLIGRDGLQWREAALPEV